MGRYNSDGSRIIHYPKPRRRAAAPADADAGSKTSRRTWLDQRSRLRRHRGASGTVCGDQQSRVRRRYRANFSRMAYGRRAGLYIERLPICRLGARSPQEMGAICCRRRVRPEDPVLCKVRVSLAEYAGDSSAIFERGLLRPMGASFEENRAALQFSGTQPSQRQTC
jgi:hypothetical protein